MGSGQVLPVRIVHCKVYTLPTGIIWQGLLEASTEKPEIEFGEYRTTSFTILQPEDLKGTSHMNVILCQLWQELCEADLK